MVSAEPLTGRTHQIRVHAAESGFPILGDTLYGGTASSRVFLHAAEIEFTHPATNEAGEIFCAGRISTANRACALRSADHRTGCDECFSADPRRERRLAGLVCGKAGRFFAFAIGIAVERQAERRTVAARQNFFRARRVSQNPYRARSAVQPRAEASPQLVFGEAAPERFEILENGVRYEMSFNEGYSVGLFLDQRDNRRRLLTGHIAADFPFQLPTANFQMLNCFAYTCGFSVCAARAGARTTSLDLSKKYLEWGRRNFALNGLDPAAHDFIYGDTFDWLRRLAKKGRAFDAVVLDPPTFSQSKETRRVPRGKRLRRTRRRRAAAC